MKTKALTVEGKDERVKFQWGDVKEKKKKVLFIRAQPTPLPPTPQKKQWQKIHPEQWASYWLSKNVSIFSQNTIVEIYLFSKGRINVFIFPLKSV